MATAHLRRSLLKLTAFAAFAAFAAFSSGSMPLAHAKNNALKLGIMSGPEEDIARVAVDVAKSHGLNVELVTFSNYSLPNEALASGDIYANAFQTQPFLDAQIKARGYNIIAVAPIWVEPLGFYSKKIKNIAELPEKARIAIPSDSSNQARALNLLAAHKLITLSEAHSFLTSLADIKENPKKFQFIELDGAQLPRSLADVEMAAINTNYLIAANLDAHTALIHEEVKDNPYINLIVVRKEDKDKPETKALIKAFQSEKVKTYMLQTFKNAILPAW
ncbi:MetQ/NlpA family ABC transporter substrate-binding protein [Entomobacter blattae]|uniref:Lipoprotein n=1 Tax=Entomobacter blattae TaxID=2762277 RepID=A0A7H1NUL5_9PROT|nr:MetQ/NlpA family ABC transporter substrate-binding protein [Entomobacter blattae]QNT79475.1 D-methionine-binding lipoprotein MetQ [Entomobacter blattae]